MSRREKETTFNMTFNRITLTFPKESEKKFQSNYFHNSLIQFRVSFALVTFLYGFFGFLDTLVAKENEDLFHLIRYGIVVPSLTFVFLLSFSKYFIHVWQQLLFFCFILAGSGIAVMIIIYPENYSYYAGMMLIFSAGYFFIKLRFFLATIAGWVTLLLFNIGAIYFSNADTLMIVSNNFFFVSANLIGMFAAYYIEFYTRKDFYLNQQLDHRNTAIEDANKNLESKVEIRTMELKLAKEQAEQSEKLKSAFLANMSHEIRTPMNGILGFASLLKEPGLAGEEQQEYIKIIEKSGERMLNIINDIVNISKIEAGMVEIIPGESNINGQIDFIHSFFKPMAEVKGLTLTSKKGLPAKESIIWTDMEKVYGILTNLVKNAIKFTDSGSIEIGYTQVERLHATSQPATYLQFYVKDTGIGIQADRQSAIFERFIQADIHDVNARQGAGLGLTISKAYVEMLGGTIWVESENGKGSTFFFTLPYHSQFEERTIANGNGKPSDKIEVKIKTMDIRILIVEDDEPSAQLLAKIVGSISSQISIVKSGLEAVDHCYKNPDIDLVLMDILMPGMNGYDATREIRQFNQKVIIIAQTAFALTGDREKALEAGCNDYIEKPIRIKHLYELIEKYLNTK